MASAQPTGNPTLRVIVVVGLALLLLGIDSSDLRRIWHPVGVFGYGTNLDGVVTGVDPDSPASRAGIQVGDRFDETTMSPQDLEDLIQIPAVLSPGMTKTFGVYHEGIRRTVSLVSVSEHMGVGDAAFVVVTFIAGLVFLGIGVVVVLLRPSPVTWGFYCFCLGYAPAERTEFFSLVPAPYIQYTQIFNGTVHYAGLIGLLIFALRFLHEPLRGWRVWAQRILPFAFVSLVGLDAVEVIYTYFIARPAETVTHVRTILSTVCSLAVVFTLIDTYVHRHGADRQRIRWVVYGFAIALLANLAQSVVITEATNAPFVFQTGLSLFNLIAPLAVAYAIVKHRVIDVNFVVSRTLVYGILTTLFVGLFALIDWFVGHVLDQTRWALIAEIAVAIGIGFWLNGLHARIDRFVDRVLFRRRHEADLRLSRLARGLPHATSEPLVDRSLVAEPVDALELASAALFRRTSRGNYGRCASTHWTDAMMSTVAADDPLLLHLQAERGAIRLSELHWSSDDVPGGGARPALALPIMVRHELEAIVLYGAHRGGEDFDPDEIRSLNALATAAGAAFDHLDADALRRELEDVKRDRDSQRLTLQSHGLSSASSS